MKFPGTALATAMLFTVTLLVPYASAQTQPSKPPAPQPSTQAPAPVQAPIPVADAQSYPPATASAPAQETSSDRDQDKNDKNNDKKKTGSGGKDDVDAIGNRKMGGKSLGDWYSLESEIKMGKQYAQQVEASVKLIQDPVVTEYVNRIGQNLVRNSDAQVPFTIKVVDDDSINAFALPGGFFYVNSGTVLAADEEAELAGVMAHEIAHVAARHAMRQLTRSNWAQLATLPLIFTPMGAGTYYGIQAAASLGMPLAFMKFSRNFESEADFLGLQYMYKSGYDPQSFVSFFEKVQATEKKKPGSLAKAFASHPQTPERIEATQHEISTILPARDQYTITTSEFNQVKARLAAIENRRKLTEDNVNKPSLRRTSTADSKTGDKKGEDDDRPTLKRRDQ